MWQSTYHTERVKVVYSGACPFCKLGLAGLVQWELNSHMAHAYQGRQQTAANKATKLKLCICLHTAACTHVPVELPRHSNAAQQHKRRWHQDLEVSWRPVPMQPCRAMLAWYAEQGRQRGILSQANAES